MGEGAEAGQGGATLFRGRLILPDRIEAGAILVRGGRIVERLAIDAPAPPGGSVIDAGDGYLSPGFVDLHVHGGGGGDFMDGTEEAFEAALRSHLRHGTTRLTPTTTVAGHEQILRVLELTRRYRREPDPLGARVLGMHFYGPYFQPQAVGVHPAKEVRTPRAEEYLQYLEYAEELTTATVAPELPGAEAFVRACVERGVRANAGHSWATFEEMEQAVRWGVRHVDHLFCAMSDRARLRQERNFPMRGGVMEATLYFDELTTEVIADGMHLEGSLLKLALKIKGADRLALVTDCSRALDLPDGGPYWFGPSEEGEPIIKQGGVGRTLDGEKLGSSVVGMDHCVRTFAQLAERPLWEAVKMASLTPARIAGWERDLGSLEVGKLADVLVLDRDAGVERVFIKGREIPI